jgi:hypothetical protein
MKRTAYPAILLLSFGVLLATTLPSGYETSISVRSSGGVAEYFDQAGLVKRVNVELYKSAVTTLAAVTATGCATSYVAPVVGTVICVIGVVGTLAAGLAGAWISLFGRDVNPTSVDALIHNYPWVPGMSTLTQLSGNYTGTPLLVAYHPCSDLPGCHELHYSNRLDPSQNTVHQLRVTPRTSLSKRQGEDAQEANDGGLYGHYEFYNDNGGDEDALAHDGNFPKNLEAQANDPLFSNQGAYCFNIKDGSDGGKYAAGGFLVLQQGGITIPNQPGEDQSWLNQCNGAEGAQNPTGTKNAAGTIIVSLAMNWPRDFN